ncbi:predicted protein [Streptomyces viridochromogenes DSM 40736]|uniref:Predicted protein n=1 Tax=Streptomyces viridochromogenes (strain DSM 40736 / JCM 4977 / BCRC 1201 / Tue 494) TaxID=591159 RepID=D9XDG0_STRVT|nr:predicted protein [Streptomyces viridochromogenes DSM 40736]
MPRWAPPTPGLRSAEAKGRKGGRRPAVPADKTDTVRTAHQSRPHPSLSGPGERF